MITQSQRLAVIGLGVGAVGITQLTRNQDKPSQTNPKTIAGGFLLLGAGLGIMSGAMSAKFGPMLPRSSHFLGPAIALAGTGVLLHERLRTSDIFGVSEKLEPEGS